MPAGGGGLMPVLHEDWPVVWERTLPDPDVICGTVPTATLELLLEAHADLRWARVQARWKAKGWFWFVDWSSGPEARSFARIANTDDVKAQPLTLEQLLDFWKKYAVEDD